MTDPSPTTSSTSDAAAAAASSPVLGADPARETTSVDAAAAPSAPAKAAAGGAPQPTVAVYRDADGREHYASPQAPATSKRVDAGEWTAVDGSDEPFDPTSHRVREVVAYLNEHAGDDAEVQRVKDAEAAGEDRATIRDWSPAQ